MLCEENFSWLSEHSLTWKGAMNCLLLFPSFQKSFGIDLTWYDDFRLLRLSVCSVLSKRPSVVVIAPDSFDVLVGDKTGDLYALPVVTKDGEVVSVKAEEDGGTEPMLGHFSVLTDVDTVSGRVASADRDNKIRVSRLPDAFVVEAFLLGHEDSVSRIKLQT